MKENNKKRELENIQVQYSISWNQVQEIEGALEKDWHFFTDMRKVENRK